MGTWILHTMGAALLWACLLLPAMAQDEPNPVGNEPKSGAPTSQSTATQNTSADEDRAPDPERDDSGPYGHSGREERLSYWILGFGSLVLIVQFLLLRTPPRRSAYEILQLLAINLIVTGTLFLISAGFGAEQIAPGLGLFGTIAGYVLGRRTTNESGKGDTNGGTS